MAEPSPSAYTAVHDASPPLAASTRRVAFFASSDGTTNAVTTSRFTWWNFLPLFLFDTFSKTANVYFLLVGVLQAVPSISPTGGIPTQLFPLVAVVLIDAAFAALEDLRRHKDDARANAALTHVYAPRSRQFIETRWQDVAVGDVIRVANHETVPADAVLLAAASAVPGVCYVETKSLDGESNLKPREAPASTRHLFVDELHAPDTVAGYVEAEQPNADVHQFSGSLFFGADAQGVPLSIKNVLLRGAKLRNADAAYALVVATGADCRVVRGSLAATADAKVSSLDALVNRQVRVVVVLLVAACVVGAAVDVSSLADLTFATAFVARDSVDKTFVESLAYYLTILCDLVPITLYVTITVVRAFQSYFMAQDLTMYDPESDTPLAVRSMQLNEQLGQITHVFTDKTGTLTCNDMVLRKCSVGGTAFEDVALARGNQDQAERVRAFFTHMALCHSVLIEHTTDTDGAIEYSAASPDEQALVCGARDHGGVAFTGRGSQTMTLRLANGDQHVYRVLDVVEFTSARKRMTVVVQKEPQGDESREDAVLVLTKGSDSVLFQRLATNESNERLRSATQTHLTRFAHDGLRTLVFATKTLTLAQWEAFHAKYRRARGDLRQVEAQSQGRANEIDVLEDELESGLELLGATAIEDRLQDGVPETIAKLRVAGVAVWMLTGDMLETAVNVGRACHLLDDHMPCHVLRGSMDSSVGDERASLLAQLDDVYNVVAGPATRDATDDTHNGAAIVLDGSSLLLLLGEDGRDDEGCERLLRVALHCRSVIACRVSPLQKAQLVDLIKRNVPDAHTLAIGDGANDVPMLLAAHVGVGIAGQEGRQAVNSSDYAFAQFRFLLPLLLVHGRWNYNRVAGLIGYTFYKNIVYSLSLFWFCLRASSYSGAMLYSPVIQQFYNLIFTVLPIALFAIQDRDLPSKHSALYHAALYRHDARKAFTQRTFWTWVVLAVVDSVALFFLILAASTGVMRHGESAPLTVLWSLGWTMLVSFVTARFCLLVHSWTVIELAGVIFSLGTMIGVQLAFDAITWSGEDFNTYAFPWLLARPHLWLAVVLAIAAILLKDVAYAAYSRQFRPQLIDHVREQMRRGEKLPTGAILVADDLEVGLVDLEPPRRTE